MMTEAMTTTEQSGPPAAGSVFVVSAPSGAGKTTLCRGIIDFFPDLRHSVSYTTRPPRSGEVDGVDYHFVSPETFREMVEQGAFAEWAEVHGNCYGTSIKTLEDLRAQGFDVLLEIDCQGAAQLRENYGQGVFIFILPPDYRELRRRLESRGTDTVEVIERRMANARDEIRESARYDYLIVNDNFDAALARFKAVITAQACRGENVLAWARNTFDF